MRHTQMLLKHCIFEGRLGSSYLLKHLCGTLKILENDAQGSCFCKIPSLTQKDKQEVPLFVPAT